jgi:hypothetical protein
MPRHMVSPGSREAPATARFLACRPGSGSLPPDGGHQNLSRQGVKMLTLRAVLLALTAFCPTCGLAPGPQREGCTPAQTGEGTWQ